jgi:hypothetical protein
MFPLVVRKHSKNESYTSTFILALSFVLIASLAITVFYFLFPNFVILSFVHKREYLTVAPLLGLFASFITIYSVLSVLVNFYLSIRATKIFIPVLFAALMQILFILLYHHTLDEVIKVSLYISLLLLVALLLYYPYATKKK